MSNYHFKCPITRLMPVQSCPHPVAVMQMYYFIIMKGSKEEWLLNYQILKALSHSQFPVYPNSLLSSSVILMYSCQHNAHVVQMDSCALGI